MKTYHALALFSGGLDSIVAAKTIAAQGLDVLCLHFVSPFFGHPDRVDRWREAHGLDIEIVDVSEPFLAMMAAGPPHGVGRGLNPCVDCKILMLSRCRELLPAYGAKCIVTGEVKGQRPMSQRRDALDVVRKGAGVTDVLLRPLSALNMKPTPVETSGLVDRGRLHNFSGRGRTAQMALAKALGVTEYPQPGGGCRLTERDAAKRYLPVFRHARPARPADFRLANTGRQFWSGPLWLALGRDQADNEALEALAEPGDLLLRTVDVPGPLGLARSLPGADWTEDRLRDAAALAASYSPRAAAAGGEVRVQASGQGRDRVLSVTPRRQSAAGLAEPTWDSVLQAKRDLFGREAADAR